MRHDPQAIPSRGGFTLFATFLLLLRSAPPRLVGFPLRPAANGSQLNAAALSVFRVVGLIHLPPLPGSARGSSAHHMSSILDAVRRDAVAWASGGANALIVENFGDVPFHKGAVGPETVSAMTLAVSLACAESGLPVGVNMLRNDVEAAVAIAALAGGRFVRANVYAGAAVTDQGLIEGRAEAVQALIRRLDAPISAWADVDVKHAAPLASRPIGELAKMLSSVVSRPRSSFPARSTGQPTNPADLQAVRAVLPATPIYIGSGATQGNLPSLLAIADGALIGTAAKVDGIVGNQVDLARVRALVAAAGELSGQ